MSLLSETKLKNIKKTLGGFAKKTQSALISLFKEDRCLTEKARLRRRRFIKMLAFSFPVVFFSLVLFLSFPEMAGAFFLRDWATDKVIGGLMAMVTTICYAVLSLCAAILVLSGMFFDFVVGYTVTGLSENLSGSMGHGIQTAWGTLRDLANMLFIFVLLYIAITTILQMGGGNTKRLLKNVIIVALLINFSMFFTHVIIDFTNAFAIAFHGAAASQVQGQAGSGSAPVGNITYAFMNSAYLPSPFTGGGWGQLNDLSENWTMLFGITFIGSAFYLILAFVLFAGAILLVSRFIMFVILIILSPLAFISNILPNTSGMFQKWFQSLSNNALFAPIFMALIWVSLVIINSLENVRTDIAGGQANLVGIEAGPGSNPPLVPHEDTGEILFSIIIAAGFLIASLIIAKSLSIQGGSHMAGLGKRWGGAVFGGATVGLAARGGRRVVGGTASRIRDSERVKNWKDSNKRYQKALGGVLHTTTDKAAKSSFDVRATGVAGGALGSAGGKGGYDAMRKEKIKKEKDYSDSQKVSDEAMADAERRVRESDAKIKEADKKGDLNEKRLAEVQRKKAQEHLDTLRGVSEQEAKERVKLYKDKVEQDPTLGSKVESDKKAAENERRDAIEKIPSRLPQHKIAERMKDIEAEYKKKMDAIEKDIEKEAKALAEADGMTLEKKDSIGLERQKRHIQRTGKKLPDVWGLRTIRKLQKRGDVTKALERHVYKSDQDRATDKIIEEIKKQQEQKT